jgi:acyl-CoA thioester hydrolase
MEIRPYRRRAQFYETDQMGIIHHANYIHWLEEARVDFMDKIGSGYGKVAGAGIEFALLGLGCEYKSMVRFDDIVIIQLSIAALTPFRMTIRYKIDNETTGKFCSAAETRHCFYDCVKKRPTSLQSALPEIYTNFLQFLENRPV